MVYRVEVTDRANRDLEEIYQYIHADSSVRAFEWFNGLEKAIYSLDQYPQRGAITRERKELRHLLYGHKPHVYRIIYGIDESTKRVRVLHLRHGARDAFT